MKIGLAEQAAGRPAEASLADDLRLFARAFGCRWRLTALIVLVFMLAGFAFVWLSPKAYTSGVSIFIDPRERGLTVKSVAGGLLVPGFQDAHDTVAVIQVPFPPDAHRRGRARQGARGWAGARRRGAPGRRTRGRQVHASARGGGSLGS